MKATDVLIIGAGPFGLAMAAAARQRGLEHRLVGKPMEFWRAHMPQGMFLRSASDWHLDPAGVDTIEVFLQEQGSTPAEAEPLSLEFYLSYAEWFMAKKGLEPLPVYVERLDYLPDGPRRFRVVLENGETILADNVVVALGFKHFKHEPEELLERLPAGRFSHTCDLVDFSELRGKRCLILGGRQSAFEWAALLNEAGAEAVHLSYRHDTPAFAEADWSWVNPLVDGMVENPGWFRRLSEAEKEAVAYRLWAEGRLKVEPWLEARVTKENVRLWPKTQVVSCEVSADGELAVTLDNGEVLRVDEIILATGYKVQLERVPLLARGSILELLERRNGAPSLDERFQSNLPGLFLTSMMATRDFGPFFAFTISARASAQVIAEVLAPSLNPPKR